MYDVFLENKHPVFIQKIMVHFSVNLIAHLMSLMPKGSKTIDLLEIGPGKGYFYKASCLYHSRHIIYYGLDRSVNILNNLDIDKERCYVASAPSIDIPKNKKFDLVYCSFVIEHLNNGLELYKLIHNIKLHLNPNGIIVFLAPDSMKLKMEFWNIDYTHVYPTTKRNVLMALRDNNIIKAEIIDIHGLIYHKYFKSKFIYTILNLLLIFYNYRFMSWLFYWIYKKPIYDTGNIFYKIYGFIKEENFLVIAFNEP